MRDLETAQMGIQASLTGHLVFSTLHTNDAPSAITRLIDMGVQAYLVSSSVVAIMAQRLVRVVCQKCKHPYTPAQSLIDVAGITPAMAANANYAKGTGCGNCQGSGFRGRLGIFELMLMSSKIRELTFNAAPTDQIRRRRRRRGHENPLLGWDRQSASGRYHARRSPAGGETHRGTVKIVGGRKPAANNPFGLGAYGTRTAEEASSSPGTRHAPLAGKDSADG